MSLMEVIKSKVADSLRDTTIPTLFEIADLDEIIHDPYDCRQISTVTVEIRYYDVEDPFQARSLTYHGSFQALIEEIDEHSRKGF